LFALDYRIARMLGIFGASWKLVFTPLTKKIRRLRMRKGLILEPSRMINLAPIQQCEPAARCQIAT
jgi:hypothetical protein